MKVNYLISATVITVILLIIAFQNIQTKASFEMLFHLNNVSMAPSILILSILGMTAGSFYTLAIKSMLNRKQEEILEEEENKF